MLTRIVLACFLSTLVFSSSSWAVTPKMIVQHGKWTAYEYKDGNSKVCYMVSRPIKEVGHYAKRGKAYVMITHRPPESFNVISFHQGYSFAPGAVVNIEVGPAKFELFTEDETAWAHNDQDGPIVDAIKKGSTIIVKGQSSRGTKTTDTYSLNGSLHVYKAMSKACGGIR